jgi:Tfp pilus assembly protein PilX
VQKRPNNTNHKFRRGAALIVALLTLLVVVLITGAVLQAILVHRRQASLEENRLQAASVAEAAIERAIARLKQSPKYTGETWTVPINQVGDEAAVAVAEIRIVADAERSSARQITAMARYPRDSARQATVQRTYQLNQADADKSTAPQEPAP